MLLPGARKFWRTKIRKARDPTFFSKHRKTWELFPQNIPSEMEVAPPPGWHKLRALLPDHSELFPLIALVPQTKFLHEKSILGTKILSLALVGQLKAPFDPFLPYLMQRH